jgi:AraC-like DNA-binding protein
MNGSIKKSNKAKTALDEQMMALYNSKLDSFIQQKVYTNPNLTMPNLAEKMKIQPYLRSQIINETYNQSFSDFTNFHRIEEAKSLLNSPLYKDQKIASVAYESGFNTLFAFNTAFKKFTKTTPSQFRT